MSTNVTLHAGHDVAYFTSGQGRGGCAGAMSYYTAAGEPPGQWAGKGAAALGLAGQVDPDVIERLYQENIGPGGELLVRRRQSKKADEREDGAVAAYLAAHPYASATELAEVRAAERGKDPHQVPYFDLTVSAVKSVSVLHASYRVSARQAREHGDEDQAAALDARADEIEDALMDSAREAVAWLERHAAYTRTGHHSARTGEWRDGGRPGRQLVPAPPVPGRRPAAPRARGDLEPGPARRRGRRQMADPGLPQPAWPAAGRGPGRRPDPGDQTVRSRLRHGAAGRRQRRRGRRRQPGRHGPVQLPRRRRHRRAGTARPRVRGHVRQAAVPAHAVAAAPAGRAEHPAHQGRGAAHHRRADRHRRAHRSAAARRLGSTDGAPRSARPVGRARAGRRGLPPSTPDVHRPCWTMRPSARRRGSLSPRCSSTMRSGRWPSCGSRCTGRSPCSSQAPTARRWSPRWPSWPSPAGPAPRSSRSPRPTSPT